MLPFIAVEGPIGVGKTSLAKELAKHFQFELLKEIVEENPFLNDFYTDIEAWSFQTEMFFLCNRYKQLSDIKKMSNKPIVADYHIFKNLIFSKRTLNLDEFEKFQAIYDILIQDMPMPSLVIYLYASPETLMKRIIQRGRAFEQNMPLSYLAQLANDYHLFMEKFEKEHSNVRVLRFNGDEFDFVQDRNDLNEIIQEVDEIIKRMR